MYRNGLLDEIYEIQIVNYVREFSSFWKMLGLEKTKLRLESSDCWQIENLKIFNVRKRLCVGDKRRGFQDSPDECQLDRNELFI